MVTRRLYRGGDSEYLLNGVPSRLRDVVEFFLGTGVGSKAYAIIEQGRIGFIVSSRPDDRRGLFDEAAGITKYKAKKKAAERRMESTRQHLLRVSDIIGEIETRLRSLRLQAQKAERYKRYKAELKDIELWSAAQRYLGFLAEEKSLIAERGELGERHETGSARLSVEEISVEAERLSVTDEMVELNAAKDDLFELSNKAQLGIAARPALRGRGGGAERARLGGAARDRGSLGAGGPEHADHRGPRRSGGEARRRGDDQPRRLSGQGARARGLAGGAGGGAPRSGRLPGGAGGGPGAHRAQRIGALRGRRAPR